MKKILGRVISYDWNGNTVIVNSENGKLCIEGMTCGVVSFDYKVNGYQVPSHMADASDYLVPGFRSDCKPAICEKDSHISVSFGEVCVTINRENSNVCVLRGGKVIHGGELGNADTVVSHDQYRLIGKKGAEIGRISWPLDGEDRFYGLGDKAGSPNHYGKRFRMYNRDSLGYDAENADPLYKSVPFFIRHNPKTDTIIGIFVPQTLIDCFDFGKECRVYYSVDINGGPFRYLVFTGDDYEKILQGYYAVNGAPIFPPLYSFGYLGSSMNYVEAWDAAERMLKFFADTEEHDLPCEGMYVSSGYLKADDGKRYSFFWNRRKFPDPKAFIKDLCARGYHLNFNIKPGILLTHPWYEELKQKGYLVKDNDGNPIVEFYWGGNASFVDFSNPDAKAWWTEKLHQAYLDFGAEGIWNDNNEFELEDSELDAYGTRTIYPVRMAQTSYEACIANNPSVRPWIYSRSGYAGLQRYARTWTGDNCSNFKTVKYNQYQGITMGLSGFPYIGHDLGGFFGPEPSAELLVRASQSAIFQCRFVIHSWREDDRPTEPWKDKTAFPLIKAAIEDHYHHMPYIYNSAYGALTGKPVERMLALEYPHDGKVACDAECAMFGPSVLKAPVVHEGERTKTVYFPEGDNWYSPVTGKMICGGTEQTFDAPLDTTWYFYKVGSVVPKTPDVQKLRTGFFKNLAFVVLPKDGTFTYDYFEDDGTSSLECNRFNTWTVETEYSSETGKGSVTFKCTKLSSTETLEGRTLSVVLPNGFDGAKSVSVTELDGAVFEFSGCYV